MSPQRGDKAHGQGWFTCRRCSSPYVGACDNPACLRNPKISKETKRKLREAQTKRAREKAEREKLARIRKRAMERR